MRGTTTFAIIATQAVSVFAADGCMTNEQCPEVAALESDECHDYQMFQARGSTAPYPGHLSDLMKLVCDGVDGTCGFSNIVYPAANGNGWCSSANEGATGGQNQMREYAEKCPDSKLIVLGFSQGGSVALDLLGGGGGKVFGCEQPENNGLDRSTSPGSRIVAAASFGPTVRNADQVYTVGGGRDFNGTGIRSEKSLEGLKSYSDAELLRTWCNEGDPICAVGSEPSNVANHLNYFERFNNDAAQWLIETAQKNNLAEGGNRSSNSTKSEDNGQDNGQGVIAEQGQSAATREALAKVLFFFLIAGSIMFAMLR